MDMMIFKRNKRLEALERVLEAIIVLLEKKKLIRREEIQNQILEDSGDTKTVSVGGIEYKIDKEDLDES